MFRGSYKGKRLRYVYAKLIGGYKNVVWSVFTDTHTHRQPTRYCGLQDFCVVSGADDGFATFDVEIRRFAKPYRIYRKTKVWGVGGWRRCRRAGLRVIDESPFTTDLAFIKCRGCQVVNF